MLGAGWAQRVFLLGRRVSLDTSRPSIPGSQPLLARVAGDQGVSPEMALECHGMDMRFLHLIASSSWL